MVRPRLRSTESGGLNDEVERLRGVWEEYVENSFGGLLLRPQTLVYKVLPSRSECCLGIDRDHPL